MDGPADQTSTRGELSHQSTREGGLIERVGVEVTIPARELAELHRRVDYLRRELDLAQHHDEALWELVVERFNPPDDDSTTPYSVIETVAACPRCRVLGRRGDEPVSR